MEKLKISTLELEELPLIKEWASRFADDPRFSAIKHFILEDDTYYGLDEVIRTNYEHFPIGDQERKFVLSAKNNNGEPVAFVLACTINLNTTNPELIIQYIVLRPDYQYQGYGYKILNDLVTNAELYFNTKPTSLHAIIDKNNIVSQNLFAKMGCNFKRFKGTSFLKAEAILPEPNEEKEDE